ncbi:MAG: EAL domain-containing protein (putative c-di-GMP-specific phosphodiesterase class I) [Moritella sp.]|jgi:EAL domain-containing protein (putative c-di-GMP-specific phosphodiesterase class I)/GGDEF domain-containing protein
MFKARIMLFLFILTPLSAQAQGVITITEDFQYQSLFHPIETATELKYEMRPPAQTFSLVNYKPSVQLGAGSYWHRLDFQGDLLPGQSLPLVLEIKNNLINHLWIFVYQDERLIKTEAMGDKDHWQPPELFLGRAFQFTIEGSKAYQLFIRKSSDGPMILPMTLSSHDYWNEDKVFYGIISTAIMATLLVLISYNTLIYASYPSSAYRWYLLFQVSNFLPLSVLLGFGYWLWPVPVSEQFSAHIITFNFMTAFCLLNFSIHFLDITAESEPRTYSFLTKIKYLLPIFALLSFFVDERYGAFAFMCFQLPLSLSVIYVALLRWRKGFYPAVFYLLSWSFLLIGAAIATLLYRAQLPFNIFTQYSLALGSILEVLLVSIALAYKIKFVENTNRELIMFDEQTGVPNQVYFKFELQPWFERMKSDIGPLVLVEIEVQGMEVIAATLGMDAVRAVLALQIEKLSDVLAKTKGVTHFKLKDRKKAALISVGSYQFIFLIRDDFFSYEMLQNNLNSAFVPIKYKQFSLPLRPVAGYANSKHCNSKLTDLHTCAQAAVMTAKQNGLMISEYTEGSNVYTHARLNLITELRKAIDRKDLYVVVQPQVNSYDGSLYGGEVLVRWHHAELGEVGPAVFIPLAEQVGFIFDITCLVIDMTFSWLQDNQQHFSSQFFSINISALDLGNSELIPEIKRQLQHYGLDASMLIMEITETAMVAGDKAAEKIAEIAAMGIKIAFDDFGIGYSSLSYLVRTTPYEIKIDRSFIMQLSQDRNKVELTATIIRLAKKLGAVVVAEGVEDEVTVGLLNKLNCYIIQGYFYSKPLTLADYKNYSIALSKKIAKSTSAVSRLD